MKLDNEQRSTGTAGANLMMPIVMLAAFTVPLSVSGMAVSLSGIALAVRARTWPK
jgi:hypothetical protein